MLCTCPRVESNDGTDLANLDVVVVLLPPDLIVGNQSMRDRKVVVGVQLEGPEERQALKTSSPGN